MPPISGFGIYWWPGAAPERPGSEPAWPGATDARPAAKADRPGSEVVAVLGVLEGTREGVLEGVLEGGLEGALDASRPPAGIDRDTTLGDGTWLWLLAFPTPARETTKLARAGGDAPLTGVATGGPFGRDTEVGAGAVMGLA